MFICIYVHTHTFPNSAYLESFLSLFYVFVYIFISIYVHTHTFPNSAYLESFLSDVYLWSPIGAARQGLLVGNRTRSFVSPKIDCALGSHSEGAPVSTTAPTPVMTSASMFFSFKARLLTSWQWLTTDNTVRAEKPRFTRTFPLSALHNLLQSSHV
jgi:hypothetical protein